MCLDAIRKILDTRTNQEIPTDDIVNLAELVLRNNNFEFDGKHFLQKRGTAIGTRMAPAYANIFMHDLESQLLDLAPVKPYLWLRYNDDILCSGRQEKNNFVSSFSGLISIMIPSSLHRTGEVVIFQTRIQMFHCDFKQRENYWNTRASGPECFIVFELFVMAMKHVE